MENQNFEKLLLLLYRDSGPSQQPQKNDPPPKTNIEALSQSLMPLAATKKKHTKQKTAAFTEQMKPLDTSLLANPLLSEMEKRSLIISHYKNVPAQYSEAITFNSSQNYAYLLRHTIYTLFKVTLDVTVGACSNNGVQ